jgi:hypothetical protein
MLYVGDISRFHQPKEWLPPERPPSACSISSGRITQMLQKYVDLLSGRRTGTPSSIDTGQWIVCRG